MTAFYDGAMRRAAAILFVAAIAVFLAYFLPALVTLLSSALGDVSTMARNHYVYADSGGMTRYALMEVGGAFTSAALPFAAAAIIYRIDIWLRGGSVSSGEGTAE